MTVTPFMAHLLPPPKPSPSKRHFSTLESVESSQRLKRSRNVRLEYPMKQQNNAIYYMQEVDSPKDQATLMNLGRR